MFEIVESMKLVQIIVLPSLLSVGLLLVGCQQREKKQQASATPPLQKSQFERDLEYVKGLSSPTRMSFRAKTEQPSMLMTSNLSRAMYLSKLRTVW
ncbi:MAG: hypothetical protein WKF84_25045 [Pyrinomonadaceae bacterium]